MNIYVGNLSYGVDDNDLQTLFEEFGTVQSSNVIVDKNNGRSKGFGFVTMENQDEASNAISKLNGTALKDREIIVNEARPKNDDKY
jgi:RNA recognition motif-containing protein